MTLLQQRDEARRLRRLELCAQTRDRLRSALEQILPGQQVIVFGSLTKPGIFSDRSDIDLALPEPVGKLDTLQLAAELSERMARPVDVIKLDRCRFRQRIVREGERWTL
jgi:predicted nucleotidyltransferase